VPDGKVKWYDAEKGFGFLSQEDGEDVYVRSSALPAGVEGLKAGQRVEFGLASGRRGPQALSVKLIDPPPTLSRPRREGPAEHKHSADELHGMVEDMITLLENAVQPELRKGRYPDRKVARRVFRGRQGRCPANWTPSSLHKRVYLRASRGTLITEAPQESLRVREVRWQSRYMSARSKREP